MSDSNFIGIGWPFPPEFSSPSSGPIMVEKEEEIREALLILITTAVGERSLHPDFGSGVNNFMFEYNDISVLSELKEELSNLIVEYESRIDLEEISLHFDDIEEGKLVMDIEYIIRETNSRSNLVYPFYLNELAG